MSESAVGVPERIGRYRVIRPLSKGGMALVYEGRRESLGGVAPRVAIKVILPDYANSSTFRELFINEARLGAAMHHQNLVQILDFDSDGDRYFLVMEYVEGLTLSKMIGLAARHDVKIPMHVICEIGRQACQGLHYAHQAVDSKGKALNLIHRDIKPSNLIVNAEGGVKILDFGISKGRLRAERSGSVKGTWGYMAPEQATGERIGPNADVFGLGIVLYEMAARKSMFKGRSEDEIRQMLLADHAGRVTATLDASYTPLATVLARAMHQDPKERFATAAECGRQLADVLPDPVTVRDEMSRFFERIQEIHQRESPRRARTDAGSDMSSRSYRRAPQFTIENSDQQAQRAMMLSAVAGMVAVVTAFVLAYAVYRALPVTPPGVGVDGTRATFNAPAATRPVPVAPPNLQELEPVQAEPRDPPPPEPTPAVVPAGEDALGPDEGYMTLDSVQDAEIYVDGKLSRPPHDQRRVWKAGKHTVSMVTEDGRRVSFVVELEAGAHERKTWDFERWDWR